jgi:hypothetical protein
MNHCGSLILTFILISNLSKSEKIMKLIASKFQVRYKCRKSKKDPKIPFTEEEKAFNKSISSKRRHLEAGLPKPL